jgi:hypothetical protein
VYLNKDNTRFLKVLILFSQHEHRILAGQKPYFKRVLPLFSKTYLNYEQLNMFRGKQWGKSDLKTAKNAS